MKIGQTHEHDTVILHLSGHLGVGESVRILAAAVRRALASGASGVVLDLSGVGYLDAAGIGVLIAAHRRALRDGRRLVLTGLRARVRSILGLARVDGVLDCARDQTSALARVLHTEILESSLAGKGAPGTTPMALKPTVV